MHEQPAQGGSPDVAGSSSQRPQLGQLQAPTSEAVCQMPRHWPRQPSVPGRSRDVPVPPTQWELTYMRSVCLSRPHTRRPLLRLRRLLHMHDGVPHTPSSVRPGASRRDEAPTWSCGFERSSYAAVKKHEWRCQAPLHPTERAPSMGPQAEQESSGCSTAPESTGASAAVGSQGAVGARPAHAARIKWVLPVQVRQVTQLLRPSTRAACSQCGAPELTLSGSFVLLINSCRPLGRWGHGEGA